jgi:hypothetical protein
MTRKPMQVLAVATGLLMSHTAGAQTLLQRNLSIRLALTIAETALAECGDRVSVAVVDRTGRLKVFLQGDNAAPHNIELARRKASATVGHNISQLNPSPLRRILPADGEGKCAVQHNVSVSQ